MNLIRVKGRELLSSDQVMSCEKKIFLRGRFVDKLQILLPYGFTAQ